VFVIFPRFDHARDFSEGLGCVRLDGKYGYIDGQGNFAISPQFEDADSFCNGRAVVAVEGRYGYIDKTGSWIVTPQFEDADDFWGGRAAVKYGGKWGYIDEQGTLVIQPQFDYPSMFTFRGQANVTANGLSKQIDRNGNVIEEHPITAKEKSGLLIQKAARTLALHRG
jgi:hypothetical protein